MKIPTLPGFDQHAFDKYFKNTGWLILGKVLSLLVAFAVARFLGANLYGDLFFSDSFTTIIAALGALGLDTFIIRELLHDPEGRDQILGTAFWMRAVVSALLIPVSIGIYLISHYFFSGNPGPSLTIIIALFAFATFFKSFNIIDSFFQSRVESKNVVRVQNICLFLSSIVKIGLILFRAPLLYFAVSAVFDGVILAAGLMIIYKKKGLHLSAWKFNTARASSLLRQSWPLIISAVMISIYMKIDAVMLKTQGSSQVGIYAAAAKISEAWYFIPVAIVTSVFPAIILAQKTDKARYQKRLTNLYDLLVIISLPVAIFISFTANDLIHLIYADRFPGAGLMLSIHIWSGIFVFLGSASSQYLLAEGYNNVSFIRTGVGALVNIALNLWLIPKYAGVGASIATLIAYFVATFSILFFKRTRQQGIVMLKSLFLISLIQNVFKK